jgi:hypothetical protein
MNHEPLSIEGFETPSNSNMAMTDEPLVIEESMAMNDEKVCLMIAALLLCSVKFL